VIYFKIELYSHLTDKEWKIAHRYNDFYELYLVLTKYFFKVPPFPNKTLGKLTNNAELNKRKEVLNNFLKV
jgi:hypothetical protein